MSEPRVRYYPYFANLKGACIRLAYADRLTGPRRSRFPEPILNSTIDLSAPFESGRKGTPREILRPQREWEAASLLLAPSLRSVAHERVNQLRDPVTFTENGSTWLLYAVAGERGIGIAKLEFET